jgi:hypothetical protein
MALLNRWSRDSGLSLHARRRWKNTVRQLLMSCSSEQFYSSIWIQQTALYGQGRVSLALWYSVGLVFSKTWVKILWWIPALSTISLATNSHRDITNRNQPLLLFHMDPTNSIVWTRKSSIGIYNGISHATITAVVAKPNWGCDFQCSRHNLLQGCNRNSGGDVEGLETTMCVLCDFLIIHGRLGTVQNS